MLGSRIELDADLRDRIALHVTDDQFDGAEARAVANRRLTVEPPVRNSANVSAPPVSTDGS